MRLGCNTRAARCTGLAQHAALDLLLRSPIEFVLVTAYAPLVSMRALESKTLNDDTNMLLCPFGKLLCACSTSLSCCACLRLAFWVTRLGSEQDQLPTPSKIHSLSRWTILSAIESITWGLVWIIPFFTELRFALLARNPEMANALCGGLTLAFRCTCSSSRVGKRPVDLAEVWPRLARFTRACGKPDRSTP